MNKQQTIHDVIIIGGGVSGAAQLYSFAQYSDLGSVLLIEKEPQAGSINSKATNNSQTLHEGDIETNYNRSKAQSVQYKSSFTRRYVEKKQNSDLSLVGPKMVVGIGESEYEFITNRFEEISDLYPTLQKLEGSDLRAIEPNLFKGRDPREVVLGLYNPQGMTINYGLLAQELISDALATNSKTSIDALFDAEVVSIERKDDLWHVTTQETVYVSKYLSVCAGAHSMYFAKKMNIKEARDLSLLCVAGNFYYTPKYIDSKIYTVQDPDLPFSAVHGDPDILDDSKTRFGPTTRMVFMLERHRYKTVVDFFTTIPPLVGSMISYTRIMLNKKFFWYALKHNISFQLPFIGNYLFWKEAQKIIPSLNYSEVSRARGQGGVRPQIVDTSSESPLSLGEAKLASDGVRFNVTPSPGATTCLYNGLVDSQEITELLGGSFDQEQVQADFGATTKV